MLPDTVSSLNSNLTFFLFFFFFFFFFGGGLQPFSACDQRGDQRPGPPADVVEGVAAAAATCGTHPILLQPGLGCGVEPALPPFDLLSRQSDSAVPLSLAAFAARMGLARGNTVLPSAGLLVRSARPTRKHAHCRRTNERRFWDERWSIAAETSNFER